jgi:hypothetical protein
MTLAQHRHKPLTESSLRSFFYDSVNQAIRSQQVDAEDTTVWYLTNLLTEFSRSERLFDATQHRLSLRAVADLYAEAAGASSESERKLVLRRLGDVALFVSGLFSGFFRRRRRLVDVDYYIAMGGRAYGYLCDTAQGSVREQSLAGVFRQLSREFTSFVDVLAEVGETSFGADDGDVLRLYEIWSKTGSVRLERKLRRLGITPGRFARAH